MKELFYKDDGLTPLFDTALDAHKADITETEKRNYENRCKDFRRTFCETPHGRRVLWLLLYETYVFRKFGQQNASAYAMEGKRELGQDLMSYIGADLVLKSLLATVAEVKKEV